MKIQKMALERTKDDAKYIPLIFTSIIVFKLVLNIGSNLINKLLIPRLLSVLILLILSIFFVSVILNMISISVHTRENYNLELITIPRLMIKLLVVSIFLYSVYYLLKKQKIGLFMIVFIFNPIIETLYMTDEGIYESILKTLSFTKNNFLLWNLSNGIIFSCLYYLINKFYKLEDFIMSSQINSIFKFAILVLIISLFMLYRANLYKILDSKEGKNDL